MIPTKLGNLAVRVVGNGPPALFWHSLFVDSATWDRVLAPLAAERTLLLVDGPSHGRSGAQHELFSLSDCADAAGQVVSQLAPGAAVDWVGNAWGGHVGIVFAESHPDEIRSLITVGTPVQALTPAERRNIVPLVALYRMLGPVRPLVKGVEKALLGKGYSPEDGRVISKPLREAERKAMHNAMRSVMLNRQDLLDVLPRLNAPTLFVAVQDDPLAPVSKAEAAARLLPCGSTTVIAGGGHVAPLLESASELAAVVMDFWESSRLPAN
jgi:pimeloyl-ACP methyl ester carboxylesterase